MSLRTSQKTSTTSYRTVNVAAPEASYRTLNVAAPEASYRTLNVSAPEMTYRTVNVSSPEVTSSVFSARSVSPMQTVSPVQAVQNGSYETVRYLVPVQQAMQQQQQQQQHSYYVMQQPMVQQMVQPVIQQPMVQCVSPMYLQTLPRLSVSSQESDILYLQQQTVEEEEEEEVVVEEEEEEEEEQGGGEEVEVEEVEIVNIIQQKPPPAIERISRTVVGTELREGPQPVKMDTRYFGELLADVYRKNCDIHSCISEHVSKIRGQKHQLDPSNDYKVEKEEVEALIPKGATELTKQQIRYLLQTRLTADKSMRLLLATFSSLREELLHMSEDLRCLESEKESLERDLSFKADQARQYDSLLEAVRENNRQLQLSLKETSASQRSLESQLMSSRNTDSSREFKVKELEGRMRALEKENEMLRQKLSGQASSTTLHIKTEELSRQYKDQLSSIRQEKDQEIQRLRTQITRIQTEVSSEKSSSDRSLQLKISELLAMLEQRQTTITRQEEEIKRLMQGKNDSSKNQFTKTIITKRYRNQYPILGLLSDDYQYTSPIKEDKTIVIESSGAMIKQETIISP
ncbi:protein POF1B isoform X1 [Scophthalmus maximus]|uniref:protein POF1B isoform X1 n=2 Tax=Scophthalmus maximus TaxID=52904 RepID=UPI001FA8D69B|nr:protein POF1B isoform X1 [Scophthalmus maximus]